MKERELVLDLGCGSYCRGDVCLDINFNWYNPYHIPQQYDFIVGGKTRINDKVLANADYSLPFRDNVFDKVLIIHTLKHLRCPYFTLREVYRVLKKDGLLVVIVPNAVKNKADWLDDTHIYSFTKPTITRLVKLSGFEVVEEELIIEELDIYILGKKV